jgi:preprotein translocase subunit YajC
MISLAHAQPPRAADPTGGLMQLLPMILMFVVLWFLMIRPQMKKAKEHKALLAAWPRAMKSSPRAASSAGDQGWRKLRHRRNRRRTEVVVQKPSIGLVLPKGTLKSL